MAIRSDIDRGYINKLESGKNSTITMELVGRISKGLGIAPSAFIDMMTTEDADIKGFLVNDFPKLDEESKDWVRRTINMVREKQREKYDAGGQG